MAMEYQDIWAISDKTHSEENDGKAFPPNKGIYQSGWVKPSCHLLQGKMSTCRLNSWHNIAALS